MNSIWILFIWIHTFKQCMWFECVYILFDWMHWPNVYYCLNSVCFLFKCIYISFRIYYCLNSVSNNILDFILLIQFGNKLIPFGMHNELPIKYPSSWTITVKFDGKNMWGFHRYGGCMRLCFYRHCFYYYTHLL